MRNTIFSRGGPSSEKLKKLFEENVLQNINHKQYAGDLIERNYFKPSCFNQTSIKKFSNKEKIIENTADFKEELQNKIFLKFVYKPDNNVELNDTYVNNFYKQSHTI